MFFMPWDYLPNGLPLKYSVGVEPIGGIEYHALESLQARLDKR